MFSLQCLLSSSWQIHYSLLKQFPVFIDRKLLPVNFFFFYISISVERWYNKQILERPKTGRSLKDTVLGENMEGAAKLLGQFPGISADFGVIVVTDKFLRLASTGGLG